jgi:serine/threonine protein phosphatase 1
LGLGSAKARLPRGKPGCRAYAIGDIHGRLDLLDRLLGEIERDMADRRRAKTFIIFLGDLIDRGPDSAGVVERVRTYRHSDATIIHLSGNHEEVLLEILSGKLGVLPAWLKFGGAECAVSYGIDPDALRQAEEHKAIELVRDKVPRAHREFFRSLADTFRFGDYLFVHAGIDTGAYQSGVLTAVGIEDDRRWFLQTAETEAGISVRSVSA